MAKAVMLYGYNSTISERYPLEWYGVTQWRTNLREAREDMLRADNAHKMMFKGLPEPKIQYKIETVTIAVPDFAGKEAGK